MTQAPRVAEPEEKTTVQKSTAKQLSAQARPEGPSWQLYFVVTVILIGALGLVGKALGLF